MAYAGEWDVFIGEIRVGSATAGERAGGRIVEFTLEGELGPMSTAVYLVGFDRRHAAYIVLAMDDSGDYWVDARGPRVGPVITALGVDDDPQFAQMGLTKEFVLAITLDDAHDPDREIFPSRMSIETRFIDTRTADREEIAFLSFDLRR